MCGRFTLTAPAEQIRDLFDIKELPELAPRYNIAPTQDVVVIRGDENSRESAMVRWGLIPFWADDPSVGNRCINARSETVAEKNSFRRAYQKRRCLIPTTGFYEWKKMGDEKQPFYIYLKGSKLGAFAGLWETWKGNDETIESCTILTTKPNDLVAELHDRMPVFLEENTWDLWLAEHADDEDLRPLFGPLDSDKFDAHPVSSSINKATNDKPDLVEEIELESADQLELL